METKFTKGKWKLANNEYGYFTSVRNLDDSRKICTSRVNNQIESNANMLLISKAPEMFEMLRIITLTPAFEKAKDNFGYDKEHWTNRVEQLLKEATEL